MTRTRNLLGCLTAALFLTATYIYAAVPLPYAQFGTSRLSGEHRLLLFHTHTSERLDIVFRRGNEYVPEAITKLDYFLRDHRTGEVRHFDPRIYDILEELTYAAGHPGGEIDIVCGYRTLWSNEFLRARTAGVAKNSLHLRGEAIDLRMPGVETSRLHEAALSLHGGGVGYYPHSDFIHVDVGRVRQWCFNCASTFQDVGGE